jgi:hypothetical protein
MYPVQGSGTTDVHAAVEDQVTAGRQAAFPPEFDWRDRDSHDWMTPVRDQGGCHTAFLYAVIGALEANIKIRANNPWLMPDFCEEDSIPEWRIDASGWTVPQVDSIKAAIMSGPVVGQFDVYEDFFGYTDGIYRYQTGEYSGEHFVTLAGWDDADSCWICKNSWGPYWGEQGWFRIAYGQCRMEDGGAYWLVPVSWGRDGAVIETMSCQYELQPESVVDDTLVLVNTFSADSIFFEYRIASYPSWITPATLGDTVFGGNCSRVEFEVSSTGLEGRYIDTVLVEIGDAQNPELEERPVRVTLDVSPTYRREDQNRVLPKICSLGQNYPNPFNAETTIRYRLLGDQQATLKVYNISGQEVATLADGAHSAGTHVVKWTASSVSSGVYLYILTADDFQETKTMVLMR